MNTLAADYWAAEGLGPPVALNLDPPAQYTLLGEHRLMPVEQEDDEPMPTSAPPGVNLSRATEQTPEFPYGVDASVEPSDCNTSSSRRTTLLWCGS